MSAINYLLTKRAKCVNYFSSYPRILSLLKISALQRAACFFLQGMSQDLHLEIKK